MRVRLRVCIAAITTILASVSLLHPAHAAEPKWESLLAGVDGRRDAIAGTWSKSDDALKVAGATGARLQFAVAPNGEYDFRVTFTRHTGVHSIALIFPHGDGQASFEVDAWGEHLAGFQNIAGRTMRENPTRRANQQLQNGRRYTMTVEVRKGEIRGLLDDQVIATHRTDGKDLSVPDVWRVPERSRIGLGAWESETTFHRVEVRMLDGSAVQTAKAAAPSQKKAAAPAATEKPAQPSAAATGKRVLIVIANHHFFYREYADPRAELERAGIRVTVAAGRKAPCRPHSGSGEGSDGGVVNPDLALDDVKAADYDAMLFSGGWGSSAYQYAFEGRYNDPAYNGERAVKATVNRLINDFIKQDKYVCALCNAVSVLAWARVNGKSPLDRKRVCAPTRDAAAGIYNGRAAQPSCRWHPEANGAVLSPAGSIGRPGTAEDDVLVDGKIVTGEDDISAREMGRQIVRLLSGK